MQYLLHTTIDLIPLLFGFITTAAIIAATMVTGAGVSAYGQYQAGKAANALSNYNANQQQINAQAAMRDADVQANAIRERNRLTEAKQRAAYGASGVVGDSGSPLMVEMQTHAYNEMHALEAERQGNIEAGRDLQEADISRIEGKNALTSSRFGAVGTILKGIGSAAGTLYSAGVIGQGSPHGATGGSAGGIK